MNHPDNTLPNNSLPPNDVPASLYNTTNDQLPEFDLLKPGNYEVPTAPLRLQSYDTPRQNVMVQIEAVTDQNTEEAVISYLERQGITRAKSMSVPTNAGPQQSAWEEVHFTDQSILRNPSEESWMTQEEVHRIEGVEYIVGLTAANESKSFLRCTLKTRGLAPYEGGKYLSAEMHESLLQEIEAGEPYYSRLLFARDVATEFQNPQELFGTTSERLPTQGWYSHTIMVPVPEDGQPTEPFVRRMLERAQATLENLPGTPQRLEFERRRFHDSTPPNYEGVAILEGHVDGHPVTAIGTYHGNPNATTAFDEVIRRERPALLLVEQDHAAYAAVHPEVMRAQEVASDSNITLADPIIGPSRVTALALNIFNDHRANVGEAGLTRDQALLYQIWAVATQIDVADVRQGTISQEGFALLETLFHTGMDYETASGALSDMLQHRRTDEATYDRFSELLLQVSNAISAQVMAYQLRTHSRTGEPVILMIGAAHLDMLRLLTSELPIAPSMLINEQTIERLIQERATSRKSSLAI